MIAAHLGGMPLEEFLPSLAGAGTGLLVVRSWIAARGGRRRERRR